MIKFDKEDILIKSGVKKRIKVAYGDSSFSNESIYSEQFTINESICSDSSLRFGGCESKSVKFRITKNNGISQLKGKKLSIDRIFIDEENQYNVRLGTFKVDSDIATSDKAYRDITAYDSMYDILKSDVSEWYNGLIFPLTIRNLRNYLFEFLEVEQEEVELPNDNTVIHSIDYSENIMAGTILKDICELNGCFGVIDNSNKFRYVFLNKNTDYKVTKKMYARGALRYENYKTSLIDGVVLGQNCSDTQIEYVFDTTINPYYIKTRILNLGTKEEMLKVVAENLYNTIRDIQFVPLTLKCIGNQCVECGDYVTVTSDEGDINTYVLSRTLTGIQSLSDNYESLVSEYYEDEFTSDNSTLFVNSEIQKLKRDSFYTYTFSNSKAYEIDKNDELIIQYNVYATEETDVVFMATIPICMDSDGEIVLEYTIDSAVVPNTELRQYLHKGNNFITVVNYFNAGENDRFTLGLMAHLEYVESVERVHNAKILSFENYINTGSYEEVEIDGSLPIGTIREFSIRAILFARGIGATNNWDGTVNIAETFNMLIPFAGMEFTSNISDSVETLQQIYIGDSLEDVFEIVPFAGMTMDSFNDYLEGNYTTRTFTVNTSTENTVYNTKYVKIENRVFELNTQYEFESYIGTIDLGKLGIIEINTEQFSVVEGIEVS